MKKHIFLSICLGMIFNTWFFAQNDQSPPSEEYNEVTIERTQLDENGNETKVVIKRKYKEGEIFSEGMDIEKNNSSNGGYRPFIEIIKSCDNRATSKIKDEREAKVIIPPKVKMGVSLIDDHSTVKIIAVHQYSPAARAGLKRGDIILSLDDVDVSNHKQITDVLRQKSEGDYLDLEYIRDGITMKTTLVLQRSTPFRSKNKLDCSYLKKPCLGVFYNSHNQGIHITSVMKGSGAEKAGIQASDKIMRMNGEEFRYGSQFDRYIKSQTIEDELEVQLLRNGKKIVLKVEVGVWDQCGVCKLKSDIKPNTIETTDESEVTLDELSLGSFEMYPVPAKSEITISFIAEKAPIHVSLIDVQGRIIAFDDIQDFSGSFTKTYSLQDAASGMAILSIIQNGKTTVRKTMIQR